MSTISFELAKETIINLSTIYYHVTPNSIKYLPRHDFYKSSSSQKMISTL